MSESASESRWDDLAALNFEVDCGFEKELDLDTEGGFLEEVDAEGRSAGSALSVAFFDRVGDADAEIEDWPAAEVDGGGRDLGCILLAVDDEVPFPFPEPRGSLGLGLASGDLMFASLSLSDEIVRPPPLEELVRPRPLPRPHEPRAFAVPRVVDERVVGEEGRGAVGVVEVDADEDPRPRPLGLSLSAVGTEAEAEAEEMGLAPGCTAEVGVEGGASDDLLSKEAKRRRSVTGLD